MQNPKRYFNRFGKTVVAGLLVGMVLWLDAMAACPALHEMIHHEATDYNHQCAVKMFAHGKIKLTTCEIPVVPPTVLVEITPHIAVSVFSTVIKNLPQGRAPPAVPSFQA